MSKYNNNKTEYQGLKFDSVREKNRYIHLKELENKGEIKNLELQKKYELQESFKLNGKTIRAINYICDFYYIDQNGTEHIEDSKGVRTDVYKIKKKLFEYKYQKNIEEV